MALPLALSGSGDCISKLTSDLQTFGAACVQSLTVDASELLQADYKLSAAFCP